VNGGTELTVGIIIGRKRCRLPRSASGLGQGQVPRMNMDMAECEGDLRHERQQRKQEIPWMPPEALHNLPHLMV